MTKDEARAEVAEFVRANALAIHAENKYASHVTEKQKAQFLLLRLQYADSIARGECDNNFTVMQRMHFYMHGNCPALLP